MRRYVTVHSGRRAWCRASNCLLHTVVAGLVFMASSQARAAMLERLTGATTDGLPPNGSSLMPRTNADGSLVVFQSSAANLFPSDTNGFVDVFLYDRSTQVVARVSQSFLGSTANDNSFPAVLNHDGRFVAFGSAATNLVQSADFNSLPDIFLTDRESGETRVLSLAQDGLGGGAVPDLPPAISQDGVHVAFASQADNLELQGVTDINQASDIFVQDTATGFNEVLTFTSLGGGQPRTANGPSAGPAISDDGCVVAFYSDASDLVRSDTNQARDVFVRDRCLGTTERVSVTSAGEQAMGPSQAGASALGVSTDGRFIVFASNAPNLDGADGSTVGKIFRRDRLESTTTVVSRAADGTPANGPSQSASVSADGRFVAFQSLASNLVPDDTNARADVFVADMLDGEVRRVSLTETGAQSDGDSTNPQISSDGTRIVFQSSGHLTADDTDSVTDVFSAENPLAGKPVPNSPTPTETETPIEEPTTAAPEDTATATPTPPEPGTPTPCDIGTPCPPSDGKICDVNQCNCVCEGPTRTSTPITPVETPTPTRTIGPTRPTATATGTGPSNGGHGGGGGGGCSIDPGDKPTSLHLWQLLLLPLTLLIRRHRLK